MGKFINIDRYIRGDDYDEQKIMKEEGNITYVDPMQIHLISIYSEDNGRFGVCVEGGFGGFYTYYDSLAQAKQARNKLFALFDE